MPDMRQVNVRVNEYFGDEQIPLSFPDGWKVNLVEMACKDASPMDDRRLTHTGQFWPYSGQACT